MDVYLVRHAQSEYNVGLTDNLDSSLTALGAAQAERTAERLADERLTHAYASPLRRALETIGPICRAANLCAEVYSDVCEFFSADNAEYHTFQGLTPNQMARDYPWASIGADFPCELAWWPSALETKPMLAKRAERVRDSILALHSETDHRILIVSHADTVGRMLEAFLRVSPYPKEPPFFQNCSVTRLHCSANRSEPAELVYADSVSHLTGLHA